MCVCLCVPVWAANILVREWKELEPYFWHWSSWDFKEDFAPFDDCTQYDKNIIKCQVLLQASIFIIPALLESGAAHVGKNSRECWKGQGLCNHSLRLSSALGPGASVLIHRMGWGGAPWRLVAGMSEACMIISEEEKEKDQQCHGRCQIPSLIISYLEYHKPAAVYSPSPAGFSYPAGETPQALTASRI